QVRDALTGNDCSQVIEDGSKAAAAVEYGVWRGKQVQLITEREPDPPFAGVDAEHPRAATWVRGRQRRYGTRAAPTTGSCRPPAAQTIHSVAPGTRVHPAACSRARRR